jgi:tRNA-splicing ligase RtcB
MDKIYGKVDQATINQFKNCLKEPFVLDGALMPDAHYGYVAPIGSVIITKGVIVPSWVGYDIGCGVIAAKLKGAKLLDTIRKDAKNIHKNVQAFVPMGLGKLNAEQNISKNTSIQFEKLLEKLEKQNIDSELFDWIKRKAKSNLGTLGHGNHFIEIDTSGKDAWIIIHSGSRNVGHKCATHYMKKAMEINGAKENPEKTYGIESNSDLGKEYLAVQEFCLEFALLNRIEILNEIIEVLKDIGLKVSYELWTNKNHNHAEELNGNKFIHRKGATPSKKNERGVIPGNMRDGTFLVIGKGNKRYLESSSHGAGRMMSKRKTRENVPMSDFKKSMKGITAQVNEKTLDESPFAYKNIFKVMKEQELSVKKYKHLTPIINWKGE